MSLSPHSPPPTPHRYLFVGGGSGGHVVPMLAVAEALKKQESGADIFFLCSEKQLDQDFLRDAGVAYDTLPIPMRGLRFPILFLRNYRKAARILDERNIDAVFCKGGGVSVPACIAAWRRKIPIVVHESDAVMGNSNRRAARFAKTVCLGFASAAKDTSNANTVVTGNPVRIIATQGDRGEGMRITGLGGTRPILLVMGGSQGALSINEAIWKNLDALLKTCDVIHLTGTGKQKSINRPGYWSSEMSSDQLQHFYAAADLCVCRAGAGSIGELAANGIPTILIPIRGLAHDHQYKNALVARDNGGCALVLQEEIGETLVPEISRILGDEGLRSQMRKKISSLHHPEAAVRIAKIIAECVAKPKNLA